MTQDEQRMLEDLASKIANTPAPPRDPEAEDFIRRQIGNRPDALYLMTQTVLIQNLALQHAQEQLRQQSGGNALSASPGGGFLGTAPQTQSRSAGFGSQYAAPPPPQYAAPQPAAPSPQMAAPSGAPSFLRGAAQTAAGVAAGAFAFEGIRSLFSHPGYGGGGFFGGGGGIGGYAPQVDETVVNNYYENPGDRGNDFGGSNADVNNYDDNSSNVEDTNFDDGTDNSGGGDDNNFL